MINPVKSFLTHGPEELRKQVTARQQFFHRADYRDIKFKFTAYSLDSENRNILF